MINTLLQSRIFFSVFDLIFLVYCVCITKTTRTPPLMSWGRCTEMCLWSSALPYAVSCLSVNHIIPLRPWSCAKMAAVQMHIYFVPHFQDITTLQMQRQSRRQQKTYSSNLWRFSHAMTSVLTNRTLCTITYLHMCKRCRNGGWGCHSLKCESKGQEFSTYVACCVVKW